MLNRKVLFKNPIFRQTPISTITRVMATTIIKIGGRKRRYIILYFLTYILKYSIILKAGQSNEQYTPLIYPAAPMFQVLNLFAKVGGWRLTKFDNFWGDCHRFANRSGTIFSTSNHKTQTILSNCVNSNFQHLVRHIAERIKPGEVVKGRRYADPSPPMLWIWTCTCTCMCWYTLNSRTQRNVTFYSKLRVYCSRLLVYWVCKIDI